MNELLDYIAPIVGELRQAFDAWTDAGSVEESALHSERLAGVIAELEQVVAMLRSKEQP